jgi:hypothetical protein
MALTVTSLNGAITQNATLVRLTAFTNPVVNFTQKAAMVVNGENMLITDATLTPTQQVVRGYSALVTGELPQYAGPHNDLAPVVYGLTSDFVQGTGQAIMPTTSYGADGAITVPIIDQTIYITKGSLCALTLAGPANDATNTVTVISLSAFAHTITYTAGFYGNTTSSDVATFPATVGGTFTFQAKNGVWVPIATVTTAGVTLG